ncbi:glycosyltransferase family 2 protein [Phycicoccus sp.]|uniref:glycosyltransferase family 2 protein n=1 Tax=Phycicoccus sp. TaxID=1902410 RepID=UPI002C473756|nr:glycosyltransferase family 2 protein [Phycicoccus sp.]HMM93436.1 glycosyltransferase family 2 protein [Phycicoccus sp.]
MVSVVIAAYNEEAVIGACLDALRHEPPLEVVVVPNGCTDDTAAIARGRGVTVVERAEPGKTAALDAGDAAAAGFPRAYLDADIRVPAADLLRLAASLGGSVLAVAPRRVLDVRGCALPVRAYAAVHQHLPVMATGLFGRGLVVLSEEGRARFERFPELVADDLFLDGLFAAGEKRVVSEVTVRVRMPRRTGELYRRLVRVRQGNRLLRAGSSDPVPPGPVPAGPADGSRSDRLAWAGVVLRRPWLAPAAVVYVALTLAAELAARSGRQASWRDDRARG